MTWSVSLDVASDIGVRWIRKSLAGVEWRTDFRITVTGSWWMIDNIVVLTKMATFSTLLRNKAHTTQRGRPVTW